MKQKDIYRERERKKRVLQQRPPKNNSIHCMITLHIRFCLNKRLKNPSKKNYKQYSLQLMTRQAVPKLLPAWEKI